ncbi:glycosyltransferase family 2 protein [Mycolicibacterium hodleri]|uniref:glycosyltransferase family 2 protein n=1 Tax=Mycolicibacterium hodleri TaxID=49897 RepID=UPI0013760DDF|nr:glycosyltransferase family 2 protein [Mycolicibacterium hodleri]
MTALLLISDVRNFVVLVCCLFSAFAFFMSVSFLVTLMYAKRDGDRELDLALEAPDEHDRESIAVLIPARHETTVLAATLLNTAWTQRDHAEHQIFAVINDDDPETMRVAALAATIINTRMGTGATRHHIDAEINDAIRSDDSHLGDLIALVPGGPVQMLVYPLGDRPPNKPQQLNFAFWYLRSSFSIFTVLDAESLAAKGLLRAVDRAFYDNPDVEIIQGGIQLMDPVPDGPWWRRVHMSVTRWYSWHNLLEYTRWFSSQMRYQSDRGFMPLGGNTVFLRRELLSKTDAWPMSLTEDCELGVRATAIHGAKTLSFYDPVLTTREETPPSLRTLVKQRRRWNIGFIQSFMAGNWRALPTARQRLVALWILSMSIFQTISLAILPLTLLTIFWIKSPAPLAVALCVPTIPVILGMVLQMLYLHEYGKSFDRRVGWYVYVIFIVTFLLYQLVLSFAAVQALVWYLGGRLGWDKTEHTGDHLKGVSEPAVPMAA